ncbi:MAG: sugar transporter [Pseudomonadota bacterium]
MAPPARMRTRHWGLLFTFLLFVVAPLTAGGYYLWAIAKDQYGSITGFTVRVEESAGASELLGGLAQLTGGQASSDGEILYEFILSQALVRAVDEEVDLRSHYSALWEEDPLFALWPDSSIEDLEWFWSRIVRVSFDQGSGLTELRVLAFDPNMAQRIAQSIVTRSQELINQLNEQARSDAMRYAREDLDEAVARLKTAREALTAFRTRTQIVDPEADIQGRMGVMNNLQQQLAEALIELDLLAGNSRAGDPRVVQAERRIEVIQQRIARERESFVNGEADNGALDEDYPTLIAEFEALSVDREFAEESYRAALAALDVARAQAARQSRYLATYVAPTRAETSEYPQRIFIFALAALFLTLTWAILALVYYSIRDRS